MTLSALRRLALSAIVLASASLPAWRLGAQSLLVAPTVVFMNHDTRAGSIELINTGAEASEVTVSTLFGYPVTDSLGRISVMMTEHPDSTQPSAASWITAYPTHIVIRPGAHQIIRLLSRAPSALPDGEYWTRLVISAKGGAVRLSEARAADTAAIRVGVSLEGKSVV